MSVLAVRITFYRPSEELASIAILVIGTRVWATFILRRNDKLKIKIAPSNVYKHTAMVSTISIICINES